MYLSLKLNNLIKIEGDNKALKDFALGTPINILPFSERILLKDGHNSLRSAMCSNTWLSTIR